MIRIAQYRILEKIGEGGMGAVYKAYDETLNREVALKVLHAHQSLDPATVQNLLQEARAAASINSQHVVKVYFCGIENGCPYIVMELMKGQTLEDLLIKSGKFMEPMALTIAMEAAKALRAGYEAGLVHGDIHPANLFIDEIQGVKILDFGFARLANQAKRDDEGIFGALDYLPPERLKREPEDFRSDIFSLGAALYHVLSGHPPFQALDLQKKLQLRLEGPPPPLHLACPGISAKTSSVIDKMLAPDPAQRFENYDKLIAQLSEALNGIVVKTPIKSRNAEHAASVSHQNVKESKSRKIRNPRLKTWLSNLLVLSICALVFGYFFMPEEEVHVELSAVVNFNPLIELRDIPSMKWVFWGMDEDRPVILKSRKNSEIAVRILGTSPAQHETYDKGLEVFWSDEENNLRNSSSGALLKGAGNGFQIEVTADRKPTTLHLYFSSSHVRPNVVARIKGKKKEWKMKPVYFYPEGSILYICNFQSSKPKTLTIDCTIQGGEGFLMFHAATIEPEVQRKYVMDASCELVVVPEGETYQDVERLTLKGFISGDTDMANVMEQPREMSFYYEEGLLGMDSEPPYELIWENPPTGIHFLWVSHSLNGKKSFSKQKIFKVERSDSAQDGVIKVQLEPGTSNVKLDDPAIEDWVLWGMHEFPLVRKRSAVPALSEVKGIGRNNVYGLQGESTFSWNDGDVIPQGQNVSGGVGISMMTHGLFLEAPAGPELRTLKLYMGTYRALGKLFVEMDDSSASTYINIPETDQVETANFVCSILYRSPSEGGKLKVKWVVERSENENSSVILQGATLSSAARQSAK